MFSIYGISGLVFRGTAGGSSSRCRARSARACDNALTRIRACGSGVLAAICGRKSRRGRRSHNATVFWSNELSGFKTQLDLQARSRRLQATPRTPRESSCWVTTQVQPSFSPLRGEVWCGGRKASHCLQHSPTALHGRNFIINYRSNAG